MSEERQTQKWGFTVYLTWCSFPSETFQEWWSLVQDTRLPFFFAEKFLTIRKFYLWKEVPSRSHSEESLLYLMMLFGNTFLSFRKSTFWFNLHVLVSFILGFVTQQFILNRQPWVFVFSGIPTQFTDINCFLYSSLTRSDENTLF